MWRWIFCSAPINDIIGEYTTFQSKSIYTHTSPQVSAGTFQDSQNYFPFSMNWMPVFQLRDQIQRQTDCTSIVHHIHTIRNALCSKISINKELEKSAKLPHNKRSSINSQSWQSICFYFTVGKNRKGTLMISTRSRNLCSNRKDCRRDLCDHPWFRSCGAFEHHPPRGEAGPVPTSELYVSRDEGNMQKVR